LNSLLKEVKVTGVEFAEIGGSTEKIATKEEFKDVIGFRN